MSVLLVSGTPEKGRFSACVSSGYRLQLLSARCVPLQGVAWKPLVYEVQEGV